MARRIVVDLFCEDAGHEAFARALIDRLADEEGLARPDVRARSVRGGHGKAVSELRAWFQWTSRSPLEKGDMLLAMIDANSDGWNARHQELDDAVPPGRYAAVALACPDPYVEAWCAADPPAIRKALGVTLPAVPSAGKSRYKRWLREALEAAGQVVLGDAMDISSSLVPHIDLFRAGKNSPSLKHCVDELRRALSTACSVPPTSP
jgi:hypothetical protein